MKITTMIKVYHELKLSNDDLAEEFFIAIRDELINLCKPMCLQLIASGDKIKAVWYLHHNTDLELKEAKEKIESWS